jgi:hypothetical protein
MSSNKRVIYSVESFSIAPDGSSSFTPVHGAQQCGTTFNSNLQQIFELGQISLYENKEDVPDVSLTAQKVLDGYPLIYHLATQQAVTGTLAGRSRTKCLGGFATFDDTQDSASGVPLAELIMSGLFVNSLTYTFSVDGNFTEDIGFIGSNRIWRNTENGAGGPTPLLSGTFINTDSPLSLTGSGGVNRQQHFIWDLAGVVATGILALPITLDVNSQVNADNIVSILPPDIDGINSSGLNTKRADGTYNCHVQSVTVSVDLNRIALEELGRKAPYFRAVQFPVQVTCAITINNVKWDGFSGTELGQLSNGNNLTNRTIKVKCQESTYLNLGTNNKLSSIDYNAGDTGGSQSTITYNYLTFNDLIVKHSADPNVGLR